MLFFLFLRVSNIQQQLALLDNESWPGMAEADRDRLQLIKEKEALLQELQLISQQRRSPEDLARLEEEKRRLEDEIQCARATSAHGATERFGNDQIIFFFVTEYECIKLKWMRNFIRFLRDVNVVVPIRPLAFDHAIGL